MKWETEQIRAKEVGEDEVKLFLNLHEKKYPILLGTLFRKTKTFKTRPRSYSNLLHCLGFKGLGVNEEILHRFNFEIVEIPFNNDVLQTTREHFLRNAVPSPFVDEKVDKQLILDVEKFSMPVVGLVEKQIDLFEEVV